MPYRTVGIQAVVDDAEPQLGGDLDVNGKKITSASNADVTIEPHGTGALLAKSGGNARGDCAVDLGRARAADTDVASGDYATIGGGRSNTVSGANSVIAGGYENDATGASCGVGGGRGAKAQANYAWAMGFSLAAQASYARATGNKAVARLEGEDAWSGVGDTYDVQRSWFQQHGEVVYNSGTPQEITAPERLVFENGYTYFVRTRVVIGTVNNAYLADYETLVRYTGGSLVVVDSHSVRTAGDGAGVSLNVDTTTHKALEVSAYASNSGDHCPVHVLHEILRVKNGYACGC